MDKRIYIIAGLGVIAVLLAVYRETGTGSSEPLNFSFAAKKEIVPQRLQSMAEATLHSQGVAAKNIRPIKDRNDIRVIYPQSFDVLNFISVMKDSLDGYSAEIFSIDNAKEKSSVVQFKHGDTVIKSFLFYKEQVRASQKGVVPSVPK